MAFICGNFNHQEEDNFEVLWPFPSTPTKKPTRRHSFGSCRSSKHNKNPYSDRGLDKFEALLADLDNKRQQIYTQKGSEDISLVRFVYKNHDELKPIVVKVKEQKKHGKDHNTNIVETPKTKESPASKNQKDVDFVVENKSTNEAQEVCPVITSIDQCKKKVKVQQWRGMLAEWWKPSYYLPLLVILILIFLMFFGRSFAILCTSFCWYLFPTIDRVLRRSKRSKKIMRKTQKSSDKKMATSWNN